MKKLLFLLLLIPVLLSGQTVLTYDGGKVLEGEGLVFLTQFHLGSFVEKFSDITGVNVGNSITVQEKGKAYEALQANAGQVTYDNMTALNFGTSAFSIVCAMRMGEFINIGENLNVVFSSGRAFSTSGITFWYNITQELVLVALEGANISAVGLDDFGAMNDDLYHLIYFTFDGVTYKGYIDNVKETSENTTVRNVNSATSFYVGRDVVANRRCNSDIAYIKAYDHELDATERAAEYAAFLSQIVLTDGTNVLIVP